MLETLDRIVRRLFVRNLHLKVIALLLTMALYLWVSVDREVERTRYAPLRMDIPTDMVLVNDTPDRLEVTIRGKWSDLARLDSAELDAIRVPVDPAMGRQGRISLTPDMVDLPPGLRPMDIEPNLVQFRLEQRRTKTVPIRPRVTGEPVEGYDVEDVSVRPSSIELSGPTQSLDSIASVETQPIDLSGRSSSFTKRVRPRVDDRLVEHQLDSPIEVTVRLHAQEVERTFEDLEIVAHQDDGAMVTSIEPGLVDVSLRGPKAVIDKLEKRDLLASVDLSGHSKTVSTTVLKDVEIHNVPEGVDIIRKQPKTCRVRLRPREDAQQARD